MMKILLLEDDPILCDSLYDYLVAEGFDVDTAHRGDEVFDKTFETRYDLYVLDVNVPDTNGFDVLQALKEAGDDTPAIYITALTDIASIEKGFGIGASDYIKKPFDPEELVIRIKTRYGRRDNCIRLGAFEYDMQKHKLYKNGDPVPLGDVQGSLLRMLLTSRDKPVDTYTLMDCLSQPNTNALRVNINKLKKKLGIEIKNIRGQGYMIENVRT